MKRAGDIGSGGGGCGRGRRYDRLRDTWRDDAGRIIGALDIVHDVTEQRETERLKNDFLTTASHELRTPVTSIADAVGVEGYDVILASNGQEALDKLEEVTPGLILLDLMMPRMNGYEFLQELERRGLRGAFPVLIVTADATAKQKAEQLGVESYVAKPFDVTKFLDKVHKLTERERAD